MRPHAAPKDLGGLHRIDALTLGTPPPRHEAAPREALLPPRGSDAVLTIDDCRIALYDAAEDRA